MKNTDNRRAERVVAELPFSVEFNGKRFRGHSHDISPTGILLVPDQADVELPSRGTVVKAWVRGPAEDAWQDINARPLRVVRIVSLTAGEESFGVALEYIDLED